MIKEYEVEYSRYDIRTYSDLRELKDDIFTTDMYLERNQDYLIDSINENNPGFNYGSWDWCASEVLENMGVLDDVLSDEADYYVGCLRDEYEDQIDDLDEDEEVEISEISVTVRCTRVQPENEEEAEELGIDTDELQDELTDLLKV